MADEIKTLPGEREIQELDELAEAALLTNQEIVSIVNPTTGLTATIIREQVYRYAAVMASNAQIANLFGIDKSTLAKTFPRELKMGRAFARQKLITRAYHIALYGNSPSERIFALKNFVGMTDNGMSEDLEEVEDGIEFKVRRPQKPIEKLAEVEAQLAEIPAPKDSEDETS